MKEGTYPARERQTSPARNQRCSCSTRRDDGVKNERLFSKSPSTAYPFPSANKEKKLGLYGGRDLSWRSRGGS